MDLNRLHNTLSLSIPPSLSLSGGHTPVATQVLSHFNQRFPQNLHCRVCTKCAISLARRTRKMLLCGVLQVVAVLALTRPCLVYPV